MKNNNLKNKKRFIMALGALIFVGQLATSKSFALMPPMPKVAEIVTTVGFAPPDYAGNFTFQILYDGAIQSVNNKGNVIQLGEDDFDLMELHPIQNNVEL